MSGGNAVVLVQETVLERILQDGSRGPWALAACAPRRFGRFWLGNQVFVETTTRRWSVTVSWGEGGEPFADWWDWSIHPDVTSEQQATTVHEDALPMSEAVALGSSFVDADGVAKRTTTAIVFGRGKHRVVVSADQSMSSLLEVTSDPSEIAAFYDDCEFRRRFTI